MNVTDLQTRVNYRRRDTTESFVNNDEILAYLNEGNRKATSYSDFAWNKTNTTFSYTDGYNTYKLSAVASDFDEPIGIFYSKDYNFDVVSPEQFQQLSGYGANLFAVDNSDLLVKTSFGSATLSLDYYTAYTAQTSGGSKIANLSVSTDTPLMPETFQDCLIDYAAAMCHYKEGMYDDGDREMARFDKVLKNMQSKVPSRKKHYSKRMKSMIGIRDNNNIASKSDVLATL